MQSDEETPKISSITMINVGIWRGGGKRDHRVDIVVISCRNLEKLEEPQTIILVVHSENFSH